MGQKSCLVLTALGAFYIVPLIFSALVAFPTPSVSDLWTSGWLFAMGFVGFASFIFGTRMQLDERILKGLVVLSGVLYGFVGYHGLFSTNTSATASAVAIALAVLIINGEKKSGVTGLVVGAMMLTGWSLALFTGVYNLFVGAGSMGLGLIILVLALVASDRDRRNVSVMTGVAAIAMVVLLILVAAVFWMNVLEQVVGSLIFGAVAVVSFFYSFTSSMTTD